MEDDDVPDHGDGPDYLAPDAIEAMELRDALRSLYLLGDDPYMTMQAVNVSVVDHFIMGLEYETLTRLLHDERTPGPEALFLSAQAQMWLLRTFRERAKNVIKWAGNGGLPAKIAALEKDEGYRHLGRELRAAQLRELLENPPLIERLRTDLRLCHIPFRRLEHIRISLAKHEVAKKQGSIALAPGYGRINAWCGSLDYQIEKGNVILGTISRRDIADELRAMQDRTSIRSDEKIASFDAFMDADHDDPFAPFDAAAEGTR